MRSSPPTARGSPTMSTAIRVPGQERILSRLYQGARRGHHVLQHQGREEENVGEGLKRAAPPHLTVILRVSGIQYSEVSRLTEALWNTGSPGIGERKRRVLGRLGRAMTPVIRDPRADPCCNASLQFSSSPSVSPPPGPPMLGAGIRSIRRRFRTSPAACSMAGHARRTICSVLDHGPAFPRSTIPTAKTCSSRSRACLAGGRREIPKARPRPRHHRRPVRRAAILLVAAAADTARAGMQMSVRFSFNGPAR